MEIYGGKEEKIELREYKKRVFENWGMLINNKELYLDFEEKDEDFEGLEMEKK